METDTKINESNFVNNPLSGKKEGPYTPESADKLRSMYARGRYDLGTIFLAVTETPIKEMPKLIKRIVKRV